MSTPDPASSTSHEIQVLLTILQQYDRTGTLFARWSVRRKTDRDLLSVQLHSAATIGYEFVAGMTRAFPFRILGPFLVQDCLEFEVLDKVLPHDTDERLPNAAIFGPPPERKRKAPDVLSAAREALLHEIHEYNSPGVKAGNAAVGEDAHGVWLEVTIDSTERVNLCFMHTAMVLDALENVKSLSLQVREAGPVLVLREYGGEERRIATSWEVVSSYKRTGTFAAVRRRVSFA